MPTYTIKTIFPDDDGMTARADVEFDFEDGRKPFTENLCGLDLSSAKAFVSKIEAYVAPPAAPLQKQVPSDISALIDQPQKV